MMTGVCVCVCVLEYARVPEWLTHISNTYSLHSSFAVDTAAADAQESIYNVDGRLHIKYELFPVVSHWPAERAHDATGVPMTAWIKKGAEVG